MHIVSTRINISSTSTARTFSSGIQEMSSFSFSPLSQTKITVFYREIGVWAAKTLDGPYSCQKAIFYDKGRVSWRLRTKMYIFYLAHAYKPKFVCFLLSWSVAGPRRYFFFFFSCLYPFLSLGPFALATFCPSYPFCLPEKVRRVSMGF